MQIQNVNMAVPVGQPAAEPTSDRQVNASQEMDALSQRCVAALRQRCRLAMTEAQRTRQEQQFEREIKGIIKKLATAACQGFSDRDGRTAARISLYGDLTAMSDAICDEINQLTRRRRRWRRWISGLLIVSVTGANAALLTLS